MQEEVFFSSVTFEIVSLSSVATSISRLLLSCPVLPQFSARVKGRCVV